VSKISIEGNASGTGTLTIAAPNTNSSYTINLPTETGTLVTTGITSGLNASALTTGTLAAARLPAGTVLQVVQTVKTDVFSASVGAGGISGEITGFTASLTPSSASNKILVMASISTGANDILNGCLLYRGGSVLDAATGDADGSKRRITSGNRPTAPEVNSMPVLYLDSPNTTSSVTYSFVLANGSAATQTIYVNRASSEADNTTRFRGMSSIVLMEIAA
jgi:hypothetical protein